MTCVSSTSSGTAVRSRRSSGSSEFQWRRVSSYCVATIKSALNGANVSHRNGSSCKPRRQETRAKSWQRWSKTKVSWKTQNQEPAYQTFRLISRRARQAANPKASASRENQTKSNPTTTSSSKTKKLTSSSTTTTFSFVDSASTNRFWKSQLTRKTTRFTSITQTRVLAAAGTASSSARLKVSAHSSFRLLTAVHCGLRVVFCMRSFCRRMGLTLKSTRWAKNTRMLRRARHLLSMVRSSAIRAQIKKSATLWIWQRKRRSTQGALVERSNKKSADLICLGHGKGLTSAMSTVSRSLRHLTSTTRTALTKFCRLSTASSISVRRWQASPTTLRCWAAHQSPSGLMHLSTKSRKGGSFDRS